MSNAVDEELKSIFARNLNRMMAEQGKTRYDICKATGAAYSTVADWCTGKKAPRLDSEDALAKYLHCKRSDLIEDKAPIDRNRQRLISYIESASDEDVTMFINILKSIGKEI